MDITLNFSFKHAMVIANLLSKERSSISFTLLNLIREKYNPNMEYGDVAQVTISVSNLMMVYEILAQQTEHYFNAFNSELKDSLGQQATVKSRDNQDPEQQAAQSLIQMLTDRSTDIDRVVDSYVGSGKNFVFS